MIRKHGDQREMKEAIFSHVLMHTLDNFSSISITIDDDLG